MIKTRGQPRRWVLSLALATGYLVTSPVGLPIAFILLIFHKESPLSPWDLLARMCALVFFGIPPDAFDAQQAQGKAGATPTEFWQHELNDGLMLTITRYEGNIFHRFVRTMVNGKPERQDLSPVFPEELQQLGLVVSGQSAMAYTLKQIQDETLIGVSRMQVMARVPAPASVPLPATQPVQPPAQAEAPNEAKPGVTEQSEHKAEPRKGQRKPNQAIGFVKFAGPKTVHPEGRAPYTSFEVALQTASGEVSFSGVDLQDKFTKGVFSVGDKVQIEKRISHFEVEYDGRTVQRKKNEFVVQVLGN